MRLCIIAALCLLILALSPVAGAQEETAQAATDSAGAVAVIGDEVIERSTYENALQATRSQMALRIAQQTGQMPPTPPALDPQQRADILERLVDMRVLALMAEEANMDATTEEAAEQFAQQREQMLQAAGSEEAYQQLLEQQGVTEEELIERIREQMSVQRFLEMKMGDVEATPEEVQARYDELREAGQLERPETVDVAHILVRPEDPEAEESWETARESIDAAYERVTEGGEEFAAVAREVSEDPGSAQRGGMYEGTPRGQMVPEFDQRAFETPVGTVTEPFRTDYGWHILTVEEKHEAGTAELEDIRSQVEQSVERAKQAERIEELVAEGREQFDVQVLIDPAAGATAAGAATE